MLDAQSIKTSANVPAAGQGIDVETARRDPGQKGFKAIPRHWVAEAPLRLGLIR